MEKKPLNLQVGDEIQLEIEKITPNGGRGLSRYKGFVIFTPFVAPGDLVQVRLEKVKKSYAEAKLLRVLEASSDRIEPKCPYFGECGGCSLQMITNEKQRDVKQSFIEEMLLRLKLDSKDVLKPIAYSSKELRYRNRIQLHQKGHKLGYFKKESHSFVAIEDCLIADEKLTNEFEILKKNKKTNRFELALTQDGKVISRDKSSKNPKDLLFSQVNESVNQKLKTHLRETLDSIREAKKSAFDLYAGAGNFTEVLIDYYTDVTAVELSKASVSRAKEKFKQVNFIASSVEKFLVNEQNKTDLILLDPPRQGLGEKVVSSLMNLRPKHIVYISCNPATLERDLRSLLVEYDLEHIKAFDMFPQTSHVESFVFLKASE